MVEHSIPALEVVLVFITIYIYLHIYYYFLLKTVRSCARVLLHYCPAAGYLRNARNWDRVILGPEPGRSTLYLSTSVLKYNL